MQMHMQTVCFNGVVIIIIYYFTYVKCFTGLIFSYIVSLILICIFIIIIFNEDISIFPLRTLNVVFFVFCYLLKEYKY